MNKNIFTTIAMAAVMAVATSPATDACTNFVAGKNATADGSTMVTYAADSHTLYGFLQHLPAADHPEGAMREVREWDTGKPLGYIPEVRHTYSVIGNMNEHQLTIAESTWGGRAELIDTTGIIDYGSLMYIALQRCKTAPMYPPIVQEVADLESVRSWHNEVMSVISKLSGKEWSKNSVRKL